MVHDMEKSMQVVVKTRPCTTACENSFSDLQVFDGTNDVGATLSSGSSNLVIAPDNLSEKSRA